ncbi:MAG: hypothetical protein GY806_01615 [Gammaproteobacteria bacterium]|nr:hypothetical protein [Gammaproteobacteria bacterium]
MKNILAFGDSLTWGSCPHTNGRHVLANRWPDAMDEGLDNVQVITEDKAICFEALGKTIKLLATDIDCAFFNAASVAPASVVIDRSTK